MQSSDLAARAAKADAAARAKDAQLADAWRLVKELQAQLALPAANRDPQAVGRVKHQVLAVPCTRVRGLVGWGFHESNRGNLDRGCATHLGVRL